MKNHFLIFMRLLAASALGLSFFILPGCGGETNPPDDPGKTDTVVPSTTNSGAIVVLINKDSVADADGNYYHSVTIGEQTWMIENLRTTKYRNGDPITEVKDDQAWPETKKGAWCTFNNIPENADIYGLLYNGYAVSDARGLAPAGWHVATQQEWMTLLNYVGGEKDAGGNLKETGEEHWKFPNSCASNASEFTARGGGIRSSNGECGDFKKAVTWWSSTKTGESLMSFHASCNYCDVTYNDLTPDFGCYVRCIRDKK